MGYFSWDSGVDVPRGIFVPGSPFFFFFSANGVSEKWYQMVCACARVYTPEPLCLLVPSL